MVVRTRRVDLQHRQEVHGEIRRELGCYSLGEGGSFPCDSLCDGADAGYYRAVTVRADAAHVFRWLCQLRVAPYFLDWVDNGGRRSPQTRTPALEQLALGQTVMRILELQAFQSPVGRSRS